MMETGTGNRRDDGSAGVAQKQEHDDRHEAEQR